MKNKLLKVLLLTCLISPFTKAQEPDPESFFPTQVGNLWQYYGVANYWFDWSILRDSIAVDGYRYLYIDIPRSNQQFWWYRLDSVYNVYNGPGPDWSDKIYQSDSDSGDVWIRGFTETDAYYAWVYDVTSGVLFGKETTIKIIKSGPLHPDSGGTEFWDTEQHLASGFGVIYHREEPYGEVFLRGCIIDGDTFGIVTSLDDMSYDLPETFILRQNYPNPFNPITTIEFSLPQSAETNLRIYDILGKQVALLFDGWHNAGNYKIKWDAGGFASGIYLAKLSVNENIKTIKMLLTK